MTKTSNNSSDNILVDIFDDSLNETTDKNVGALPIICPVSETAPVSIAGLPEFDPAVYLESAQDIAAYLNAVLEENDAALLAAALGDIARSKGMTKIAIETGITREALYKALRPASQPRLETILRVCSALGVKLVAEASRN